MPQITSTFAPAAAAVPGAIVGQPAARPVRLLSATLPTARLPAHQRWRGPRRRSSPRASAVLLNASSPSAMPVCPPAPANGIRGQQRSGRVRVFYHSVLIP